MYFFLKGTGQLCTNFILCSLEKLSSFCLDFPWMICTLAALLSDQQRVLSRYLFVFLFLLQAWPICPVSACTIFVTLGRLE
jgi:hypothetical protein